MKNRIFYFLLFFSGFFSVSKLSAQAPVWSPLLSGLNGTVNCVTLFHNELYAGGTFTMAGSVSVHRIAKWDGAVWQSLSSGMNNAVYALVVYNDELYAGGHFMIAGGIPAKHIAKWNGLSWDSLGGGILGGPVYTLCVYHNKLIAGGKFNLAGDSSVNNIAQWDGTSWSTMGDGVQASFYFPVTDCVQSLIVFHDQLIVGGAFDIAGTDSLGISVASWNDMSWVHIGEGLLGNVLALSVFNDELYAGGIFYFTGNLYPARNFTKWTGTNWAVVGTGMDNAVKSLFPYGNKLYVAGDFTMASSAPVNYIASFDGTSFSPLSTGTDARIKSIVADEGILFAGGDFANADGIPSSRIAKWSPPGLAINEFIPCENISLFPNPNNGNFSVTLKNGTGKETIEIYNMLGEKISEMQLKNSNNQIDLSTKAHGIYFYKVVIEEKRIASGKIIVD